MEKKLMSDAIVMFDVEAESAEEIIRRIADMMDEDGRLIDKEGYVADVMAREASSSTAVGFSVATPHSKSVHVKEPSLAFCPSGKAYEMGRYRRGGHDFSDWCSFTGTG